MRVLFIIVPFGKAEQLRVLIALHGFGPIAIDRDHLGPRSGRIENAREELNVVAAGGSTSHA